MAGGDAELDSYGQAVEAEVAAPTAGRREGDRQEGGR